MWRLEVKRLKVAREIFVREDSEDIANIKCQKILITE